MSALDLGGRRIVVTGVLTRSSIAYAVAERLLEQEAEVILTGFGRTLPITERAARWLPGAPPVVPLDVNDPGDLDRLTELVSARWDRVDGVLHSVAAAPADALSGHFLRTPRASAAAAFRTSAFSLNAVTRALLPLLDRAAPPGASVVTLDFDASRVWPGYDWMGVAKAALESVARYLARELGPRGSRVNLVSAGPIGTVAASGVSSFELLVPLWRRAAPLGWDPGDAGPVADAACYLLSPWSAGVTGALLHVDGGLHALGAPGLELRARDDERGGAPRRVPDRVPMPQEVRA